MTEDFNSSLEIISNLIDSEDYEKAFSTCNNRINKSNTMYQKVTWCLIKQKIIQIISEKSANLPDDIIFLLRSHIDEDTEFINSILLASNSSGDALGVARDYSKLHNINKELIESLIPKSDFKL